MMYWNTKFIMYVPPDQNGNQIWPIYFQKIYNFFAKNTRISKIFGVHIMDTLAYHKYFKNYENKLNKSTLRFPCYFSIREKYSILAKQLVGWPKYFCCKVQQRLIRWHENQIEPWHKWGIDCSIFWRINLL